MSDTQSRNDQLGLYNFVFVNWKDHIELGPILEIQPTKKVQGKCKLSNRLQSSVGKRIIQSDVNWRRQGAYNS
jgi:hypothetical protein